MTEEQRHGEIRLRVHRWSDGRDARGPGSRDAEWGAWFGTLGSAIIDGGNPFGASTAVKSDGSTGAASGGLGGYSIIEADSLELAAKLANGCPVLESGGSVEVYEALPM